MGAGLVVHAVAHAQLKASYPGAESTMHMFYGDYECDGDDDPEEEDQSNQQMSGSQFSDEYDDHRNDADEDGESEEAGSPVQVNESKAAEGDKAQYIPLLPAAKKEERGVERQTETAKAMNENLDIIEQMATANGGGAGAEMTQDQMKFLDILQQSKLKKNGSQRPMKNLRGSTKNKRQKNKS